MDKAVLPLAPAGPRHRAGKICHGSLVCLTGELAALPADPEAAGKPPRTTVAPPGVVLYRKSREEGFVEILSGISLSATRLMTPEELSKLPRTISAGLVKATLR